MTAVVAVLLAATKKFWILDPLYAALGQVLSWLYAIIPSYGVSIILLTASVCLLRMPLVAKQVKSQQEMQRIQPELKRIQAKYKNEPQKRNEELMALYKEHNVNPFAGCLPLVLQMPLFIVLYRLILNLNHRPHAKHIPTSSKLYKALEASGGKMKSFGMDLAQRASQVHGFGKLFPYAILIAAVIMTGLFQQRQMTARLPADAKNNQMAVVGKIFPLFLGFISFSIPAGVVLYFFVSNIWQIGQQAVLFRRQPIIPPSGKGGGGGGSGGGGKSGGTPAKSGGGSSGSTGKGGDSSGSAAKSGPPKKQGLFARLAEAATEGAKARDAAAADGEGKEGGSKDAGRNGGAKGAAPPRRGSGPAAKDTKSGNAAGGKGAASGNGRGSTPPPAAGRRRRRGRGAAAEGSGSGGSGSGSGGSRPSGNGRITPKGGQAPQNRSGRSKPRNTRRGK